MFLVIWLSGKITLEGIITEISDIHRTRSPVNGITSEEAHPSFGQGDRLRLITAFTADPSCSLLALPESKHAGSHVL